MVFLNNTFIISTSCKVVFFPLICLGKANDFLSFVYSSARKILIRYFFLPHRFVVNMFSL